MGEVLRFTLLAYGISWAVMLPLLLDALGVLSLGLPPHLHGLAALGPLGAAYALHRSRDPGFRISDLHRRRGTGGVGAGWWLVLAATPVLFLGAALAVAGVVDGPSSGIPSLGRLTSPALGIELLIVSVIYGFGEEPAWRGWLLPRLQEHHHALRSTLIVAMIWAVWHLPFLVPGIRVGGAAGMPGFFIGLLAAAFWLTFVFNSTGGSVLAASLWHTLWNAASVIARPSATASAVLGSLLAVTGFGLAALYGRRGMRVGAEADT